MPGGERTDIAPPLGSKNACSFNKLKQNSENYVCRAERILMS